MGGVPFPSFVGVVLPSPCSFWVSLLLGAGFFLLSLVGGAAFFLLFLGGAYFLASLRWCCRFPNEIHHHP